jgi:diguanylate cyclase (GGDEF)-like protein/PAS domain S-box-containing protein
MSRQSHRQFHESDLGKALPSAALPDGMMAAALALAQRRFEATFLHAPVGIAHVGLDGSFLLVNPRFCEISGHAADTLMRTGFQQITHPDDLDTDQLLLARLHAGDFPRYTLEKRYIRADGTIIWINLTVAMVRDAAGHPEFYVAVIEDLSELRQASFEAIHDPLTGLLNRRGLAVRANAILADAARIGTPVSLIFLDLDGFKQLNDSRGHAAGDACLVDVAALLSAHAGANDAVARVGGDEFLMLVPALDAQAAAALGETVRQALAALGARVSGSFGLVTTSGTTDLDRLIDCADSAMLAAKRAGKNQLRVATFR